MLGPDDDPLLQWAKALEQERRNRLANRRPFDLLGFVGRFFSYWQFFRKIIENLWKYEIVRAIWILYGLSFAGVGLAWSFWSGAAALRQDSGIFQLGLGLATLDLLLFALAVASALATVWAVVHAVRLMNWGSKIIVLFFAYRLAVWWIHGFSADEHPLGAYFFCTTSSFLVEGVAALWRRRRRLAARFFPSSP